MNKSDLLKKSIDDFYAETRHGDTLVDILEKRGDSGISLRNIEWFITNYSKKNHTSYMSKDGKIFTVHTSYKSSLDGYSKRLFDPFCRASKITYDVPNTDHTVKTTLPQLNFLKWCITKGIIDFMRENKHLFKRGATH